ncbi:MAG: aldolase [Candidatus Eremiobacteraeota bacterium]|nr:aldolase [Candidatus Eremiobacteraeota bacterium]
MPAVRNIARERLQRGELALGAGVRFARSHEIAKLMQSAGYDFLFIDLEHGALSLDLAAQISVAALDAGITPIPRVPSGEYAMATRLLDNGALGIVFPHVDGPQEASAIVDRLKFPPQGHRSMAGNAPQLGYAAVKPAEYASSLNAAGLIVAMIETPDAVENADAIAAVEGIDVLLVGTNDLCAEMGIHGDFGNRQIAEAYRRVVAACGKHGKWAGMGGVYDETIARRYIELGARFILSGSDLTFMLGAARSRADYLRSIETKAALPV